MATAAEAARAKTPLGSDLAEGVKSLALDQQITFELYVRVVLPIDGFVFWVKAQNVSKSALYNALLLNAAAYNAAPKISAVPANTIVVTGSLHYSTVRDQDEASTVAVNRVIFTAISEVQDFNLIGANAVYVATYGPDNIRFAFSQRGPFYQQADLYHYVGNALYSTMETQLIDNPGQLSQAQVVSNSLPLWLAINSQRFPYATPDYPVFPLYPSFAVPDNIAPPFAAIHIEPNGTRALQGAPYLDQNLSHWQLVRDDVKITFYGVRNDAILSFLDFVNEYSLAYDTLGIMNIPIPRDEKQTQPELAILAQKKTINYEVSYYQASARNIGLQLLGQVIVGLIIAPE